MNSQKSSIDCLSYELREGQRVVFRASGFTLCSIGVILNLGGDRRFQVTKVLQDPRKVCTVDCRGAAPATQGTDRKP